MLPAARVVSIATLDPSADYQGVPAHGDAGFQSDNGERRVSVPYDPLPPPPPPSQQSQAASPSGYSGGIGTGSASVMPSWPAAFAHASPSPATPAPEAPAPAPAPAPAAAAEEEQEPPIEELVNRAVVHVNRPIEHMPAITPPELKLIGRCVTFKGDTTVDGEKRSYYYEGLVATINKETVMLIHVHRYTEEDFQLHKLQIRHHNTRNAGGKGGRQDSMNMNMSTGGGGGAHDGEGHRFLYRATGAADAAPAPATREEQEATRNANDSLSDNGSTRANGNDFDMDNSTTEGQGQMLEPEMLNDLGETHAEATTRVRNRMRGHHGSMGPIPYVTFSRSHIHRVEFGIDPRSSFYSIFHDPTKLQFDMQCLRMFVRRYLIHTAQGNNPRAVPLRSFITCRCNCPDLDNDLLVQTAREELAHLIKIHRDVKRAKKKKEQGRRNVLRSYRAPNGLFRHTGVLYLTHLPRQTFSIGVMQLLMLLVLLVYQVSDTLQMDTLIIAPYIAKLYPYVFSMVAVSIVATGCTLVHSVRMCVPVQHQLYLVSFRAFFVFGAVACSIMTMIVSGELANFLRWVKFYKTGYYSQERLCMYYATHACSGIYESCVEAFTSPECQCSGFTSPTDFYPYSCDAQILVEMQRRTIPLVCVSFLLFISYLFDGYLHLRLFHVSRLLERRM